MVPGDHAIADLVKINIRFLRHYDFLGCLRHNNFLGCLRHDDVLGFLRLWYYLWNFGLQRGCHDKIVFLLVVAVRFFIFFFLFIVIIWGVSCTKIDDDS